MQTGDKNPYHILVDGERGESRLPRQVSRANDSIIVTLLAGYSRISLFIIDETGTSCSNCKRCLELERFVDKHYVSGNKIGVKSEEKHIKMYQMTC